MNTNQIIKGDDLMVFDENGNSLGFATSHTMNMSGDSSDLNTKDSGIWTETTVNKLNWEITTDNLFCIDVFENLIDKMFEEKPVTIYFGEKEGTDTDEIDSPYDHWRIKEDIEVHNTGRTLEYVALKNYLNYIGATEDDVKPVLTVIMSNESEIKTLKFIADKDIQLTKGSSSENPKFGTVSVKNDKNSTSRDYSYLGLYNFRVDYEIRDMLQDGYGIDQAFVTLTSSECNVSSKRYFNICLFPESRWEETSAYHYDYFEQEIDISLLQVIDTGELSNVPSFKTMTDFNSDNTSPYDKLSDWQINFDVTGCLDSYQQDMDFSFLIVPNHNLNSNTRFFTKDYSFTTDSFNGKYYVKTYTKLLGVYTGQAVITSLTTNANSGENATFSATFKGVGNLSEPEYTVSEPENTEIED